MTKEQASRHPSDETTGPLLYQLTQEASRARLLI
jgi:hypothetical protein